MSGNQRRTYGTGSLYQKNGAWYGRWRDADGRHARKLGPVKAGRGDGLTKREAESKLRVLLLAADGRERRSPDQITVGELAPVLLARLEERGRKPSHLRSTGYHLSVHIVPQLGDLEVRDVEPQDVKRLVDHLIRQGRSPEMVRNVAGTLHSLLRLAVDRGVIDRNPVEAVELPRVPRSDSIRFLTRAELERVLSAPPVDGLEAGRAVIDQWPVTRLVVLTAAMTGMRLGELRALRWDDLDFGASKVRVRRSYVRGELSSPKSKRSVRAIPLATRLVAELEAHRRSTSWNQDDDFVLAHPHTGRPLDDTRLLRHFKAALRRAGVREVRIHDLRHTFATTVAASGAVSLRTLQEWMGHRDIQTTLIYADYMPGEHEQEQLDAAFGGPNTVANLVANACEGANPVADSEQRRAA